MEGEQSTIGCRFYLAAVRGSTELAEVSTALPPDIENQRGAAHRR